MIINDIPLSANTESIFKKLPPPFIVFIVVCLNGGVHLSAGIVKKCDSCYERIIITVTVATKKCDSCHEGNVTVATKVM